MSQSPAPISISQANPTTPPIDPTPLLQYGDNPTAIILSIAILLWVLRPVMLRQQSNPGETSRSTQGKYTALGKRAIASFVRVFNSEN